MSDQVPPATAEDFLPKFAKVVERDPKTGHIVVDVDGIRVSLPPEAQAAMLRMYQGMSQPLPTEMTTNQAADFLDVSRPFIIKLIKKGELPCRMVGKHRRIPTAALVEQREKMFQRAKVAMDEMVRLNQEMDLYDLEGPPPGDSCYLASRGA